MLYALAGHEDVADAFVDVSQLRRVLATIFEMIIRN